LSSPLRVNASPEKLFKVKVGTFPVMGCFSWQAESRQTARKRPRTGTKTLREAGKRQTDFCKWIPGVDS
jgi:hypothetical protein